MYSSGEPRVADVTTDAKPDSSRSQSSAVIESNVLMVKIRGVSFGYELLLKKSRKILEDINMSFPRSAIYGLLGPSGCGKTTLLKLILGLKKPNSGTIQVMDRKPNDPKNNIPGFGVGFMPQETALYEEFTIRETLKYFARIYGMTDESTQKRTEFLLKLVELTEPDVYVTKLSGGQKRRVSLAAAIIHNPPFIILDEPTVGVDPILREKIWEHLVEMSNKNKTSVLITTHYVEEARRAHVVALMRNRRLIVEQTPEYLLNYFKVDSLEEMFLKVCIAQDEWQNTGKQLIPKSFVDTIEQKKQTKPEEEKRKEALTPVQDLTLTPNGLKRFYALSVKNSIRLYRQKLLPIFEIISPAVSITLFLLCIGDLPRNMEVAVYNGEEVEGPTFDNRCQLSNLSAYFLSSIDANKSEAEDPYLKLRTDYKTINDAKSSVVEGHNFGALIIDRDFSGHLCYRLTGSRININKSTIQYFGDLTDITIHTTIMSELKRAQLVFTQKVVNYTEKVRKSASNGSEMVKEYNMAALRPVLEIVSPPVFGELDISFRDFMTPGMIIAVVFILAVGLTALSFVAEKRVGVMDRTLMAGVRIYEILIAQIFIQFFVLLIQITVLLMIVFYYFEQKHEGSYLLIGSIILMQGILGMTYGLLISMFASEEQSALLIAFGSFFPMLFMSGIFWPIEGMRPSFQIMSYFMPQTLAVMCLRWVMVKGWDMTHIYIWLGFVSTTIWFIIFSSLSVFISTFWR